MQPLSGLAHNLELGAVTSGDYEVSMDNQEVVYRIQDNIETHAIAAFLKCATYKRFTLCDKPAYYIINGQSICKECAVSKYGINKE